MDHFTGTLTQMNFPTKMTLAVGYALAVPPLLAIVPVFRNPVGRTRFLNIPHRVVLLPPTWRGLRLRRMVCDWRPRPKRCQYRLGDHLYDHPAPLRKQTPPPTQEKRNRLKGERRKERKEWEKK